LHFRNQRYRQALDAYEIAVRGKVPVSHCPGVRTALAELALAENRSHPIEEVERLRQQLGFPPIEATWEEWFAAGRKYQTSRAFDLAKAVAAYSATIEFLEHPERGGLYHLGKEPGSDRISLRWGPSLAEVDLLWSRNYDSRWLSSAYYLAQCLIEL